MIIPAEQSGCMCAHTHMDCQLLSALPGKKMHGSHDDLEHHKMVLCGGICTHRVLKKHAARLLTAHTEPYQDALSQLILISYQLTSQQMGKPNQALEQARPRADRRSMDSVGDILCWGRRLLRPCQANPLLHKYFVRAGKTPVLTNKFPGFITRPY